MNKQQLALAMSSSKHAKCMSQIALALAAVRNHFVSSPGGTLAQIQPASLLLLGASWSPLSRLSLLLGAAQIEGDPAAASFHGEFKGKAAIEGMVQDWFSRFELQKETLIKLIGDGEWAAAELSKDYKAKASGKRFHVMLTQWWQVKNGKITSVHDYFDTARVLAAQAG